MTIPILPGPFSFLGAAGDAGIQAYYRAQARKDMLDQLKRQQDLQNVGLFTQLLPFMQPTQKPPTIVPSLPTPLGSTPATTIPGFESFDVPSNIAESFKRITGGVPRLNKSAEMRQQESQAKVAEGTEESKIAQEAARTRLFQSEASSAEFENEFLQGLNPAQLRQLRKVAPPETAQLIDKLQLEQTKSAIGETEVSNTIRESLLKRLPKDDKIRNIAEYAAIGGLGILIAELQQRGDNYRMAIQGRQAQLSMLRDVTATARQAWLQDVDDWRRELFAATEGNFQVLNAPEKKRGEILNNLTESFLERRPEPTFDASLDQVLKQVGMTKEEYQKQFRFLSDLTGAPPTQAKPTETPKRKITQDQADFLKAKGRWDPNLYEIIK